jgi:hypothetical protein
MNSMDCFIAKGATSWSIKCINGFVECLVPIESQYLVISLTIGVNWDHQLRFLTIQIVNLRELEFHWNWLWCQFLPFGIISMNFRHFRIISVGFSRGEKFLPFGITSVGFHVKFLHFIIILLSHRIKWGPAGEQLLRCAKPG